MAEHRRCKGRGVVVRSPETSMHSGGVLKYTMHTWNILEDYGNLAMHEDKIMPR